jgi:hypothetical protein
MTRLLDLEDSRRKAATGFNAPGKRRFAARRRKVANPGRRLVVFPGSGRRRG